MPKDFVTTSIVKAANRSFTQPIISAARFDEIIASLTGETNPLGAVSYQSSTGTVPGALITDETYKATIEYFDETTGAIIGTLSLTLPTRAMYDAVIAHIEDDEELSALFTGNGYRNDAKDSWNVRVKVHDPNGENYFLNLSCKNLKLSSFESDTILQKVDTWADAVPELN